MRYPWFNVELNVICGFDVNKGNGCWGCIKSRDRWIWDTVCIEGLLRGMSFGVSY